MAKLASGFLMFSICLSLIAGWMQGGGGILAVPLTASITDNATQIPMADTTGWADSDVVSINNEYIFYDSKDATHLILSSGNFRGYDGTRAAAHTSGTYIYTETAAALNQSMGFNAASLSVQNGIFAAIVIPMGFLTFGLPRSLMAGEALFTGDLAIIQYFYLAAGFGFYLVLAISIGMVVAYVLRR